MFSIVVKTPISVVKSRIVYMKVRFIDVLCSSWNNTLHSSGKRKKALLLKQDPFTRTLYENEKLLFLTNYTLKISADGLIVKLML